MKRFVVGASLFFFALIVASGQALAGKSDYNKLIDEAQGKAGPSTGPMIKNINDQVKYLLKHMEQTGLTGHEPTTGTAANRANILQRFALQGSNIKKAAQNLLRTRTGGVSLRQKLYNAGIVRGQATKVVVSHMINQRIKRATPRFGKAAKFFMTHNLKAKAPQRR